MATTNTTPTPAPASKGGIWYTWPLRLATLIVAIRLLGPGVPTVLRNAGAHLRNGWGRTHAAADTALWWLSRQVRHLFWLTTLVGGTTLFLLIHGLADKSRCFVAAAGILWVLYLIVLWALIRVSVSIITSAVGKGIELIGAALMAVLKKVGLADGEGDTFAVDFKNIDEALRKGFVVLPAFAEMFFFLALIPSFATLLIIAIIALGAIASGLNSAHIGDSTVNGWRLVNRVNFYLLIALAGIAFLVFFFPNSFGKYANPGALDAWLVNPSWGLGFGGTILATLAIGAALWILTACIKGETGERLAFVIMIATIIAMCVGGYHKWGSWRSHKVDAAETIVAKYEPLAASPYAGDAHLVSGPSASSMTMPDMDYKPGVSEPTRGSAKPVAKSGKSRFTVPKVNIKKRADGLDSVRQNNAEIEAILGI